MCHVLNAWRVPIRPPKEYPVFMGATIVPRANIQQKNATRNHRIVKPVLSGSFKICPATPRVTNAPVDLSTTPKVPRHAMRYLLVRTT